MENNFFDCYTYNLPSAVITGTSPTIEIMEDPASVINIPAGKNYIEILGFKIDGYNSFEAFIKELKDLQNIRDLCNELQQKVNLSDSTEMKLKERLTHLEEENRILALSVSESDRTLVNYFKEHYVHKGKIEKLINDIKETSMAMPWNKQGWFSFDNYRRDAHSIQILEKLLKEEE